MSTDDTVCSEMAVKVLESNGTAVDAAVSAKMCVGACQSGVLQEWEGKEGEESDERFLEYSHFCFKVVREPVNLVLGI